MVDYTFTVSYNVNLKDKLIDNFFYHCVLNLFFNKKKILFPLNAAYESVLIVKRYWVGPVFQLAIFFTLNRTKPI